jgi:hypothetical protein
VRCQHHGQKHHAGPSYPRWAIARNVDTARYRSPTRGRGKPLKPYLYLCLGVQGEEVDALCLTNIKTA